MNRADLYVFSGTGNTWLAASRVRDVLCTQGSGATLHRLENANPAQIDPARTLGLAFPIACFATYPLVTDFLQRLPQGNGGGVFLLTTLGGNSGQYPGRLRALFEQKGYALLGAAEVIMPDNIFGRGELTPTQQTKIAAGLARAEAFAHELLEGRAVWPAAPAREPLLARLSGRAFQWKFGQRLRPQVRPALCTGCGLCVRLCPAHNIIMKGDGKAHIEAHCQFCLRCRGLCPAGAIRTLCARAYHSVNWTEISDA